MGRLPAACYRKLDPLQQLPFFLLFNRYNAFANIGAATTVLRSNSRDLKAKGLVAERYTTTSYFADAGVTEDMTGMTESKTD